MKRLMTSIIADALFDDDCDKPFEAIHVKKKVKKEDTTNEKQLDDGTAGGHNIDDLQH